MRVLGIDPGIASMGVAEMELLANGARFRRVHVFRTQKSPLQRRLRVADDTSDRVRQLCRHLLNILGAPDSCDVVALCVESTAFPIGKVRWSVLSNLGRIRGVIDTVAEIYRLPIIEETPQAIKRTIAGKATASKKEVQARMERDFPELALLWPTQRTLREHAADAAAMAAMGYLSDAVRLALKAARPGGVPQ